MLLIINLPDLANFRAADNAAAYWSLFDAKGYLLRSGRDTLSNIPRAEKLIATVPASRIVFMETPLPQVSHTRREALLRYAIEDKLTIDPETIHAVLLGLADGKSDATGSVKTSATPNYIVGALDRDWVRSALAWLGSAKLNPRAVFAETEIVAAAVNEWAIVIGKNQSYAKRHDGFAYSLDSGTTSMQPPFALSLALREVANPPTALAIYTVGDEATPINAALANQWQQALKIPTRFAGQLNLAQSGMHLWQRKDGNLLTGEFKPHSAGASWAGHLQPVTWLLAALFSLQLLFSVADWRQLDWQRIALEGEMRQLFQTAFPKALAIVDAPLQLKRNLESLKRERGLRHRGDPRPALARLANLAKAAPGLVIGEISVTETSAILVGSVDRDAEHQLRQAVSEMPNASLEIKPPKNGDTQNIIITLTTATDT